MADSVAAAEKTSVPKAAQIQIESWQKIASHVASRNGKPSDIGTFPPSESEAIIASDLELLCSELLPSVSFDFTKVEDGSERKRVTESCINALFEADWSARYLFPKMMKDPKFASVRQCVYGWIQDALDATAPDESPACLQFWHSYGEQEAVDALYARQATDAIAAILELHTLVDALDGIPASARDTTRAAMTALAASRSLPIPDLESRAKTRRFQRQSLPHLTAAATIIKRSLTPHVMTREEKKIAIEKEVMENFISAAGRTPVATIEPEGNADDDDDVNMFDSADRLETPPQQEDIEMEDGTSRPSKRRRETSTDPEDGQPTDELATSLQDAQTPSTSAGTHKKKEKVVAKKTVDSHVGAAITNKDKGLFDHDETDDAASSSTSVAKPKTGKKDEKKHKRDKKSVQSTSLAGGVSGMRDPPRNPTKR